MAGLTVAAPIVRLPILCACGAEAVVIDPGQAPERAGLPSFDAPLSAGRPVTGRCLGCWPVLAV